MDRVVNSTFDATHFYLNLYTINSGHMLNYMVFL